MVFGPRLLLLLPVILTRCKAFIPVRRLTQYCQHRTQGRAASPIRPCSGQPSQYSRALSPLPGQPRKPVTGVAGKGLIALHCMPHQGCRDNWQQGCFQPPWASMRKRPGISKTRPSDWGWLALNPDQVLLSCIAMASKHRETDIVISVKLLCVAGLYE